MPDYVPALLCFLSVLVCLALGLLVLARAERGPVHWAFAASLAALALAQMGNGLSVLSSSAHEVLRWRRVALVGEVLMPIGWLVFSLTFARVNTRTILQEWKGVLSACGLLTALFLGLVAWDRIFNVNLNGADGGFVALGPAGRIYASLYLIAQVLILANLEQTLRHANQETRWYIKFPVVGLGLLCVYFLYQTSDLLLYSVWHPELVSLSGVVACVACGLMGYGLLHRPIPNVQIYISRKVISGSLTFMIVGGFLTATGLTAWFLRYSRLPGGMILSILFVLLAVTGLVFVLLSSRLRQGMSRFVERHFFPHKYDYRTQWMEVSEALGEPGTPDQIAWRGVQLVKGIFGTRRISIWMATGLEDGIWTRIGAYNVGDAPERLKDSYTVKEWLEAQK
ncbi:MAG: histidine kinase N-terminal 7TM domain-containing protein, partial [Nitrospiraceae bacterium]